MVKINTFADVHDSKRFWFADGSSASSVGDLYKKLKDISNKEFSHHCNDHKNDFYNWVFDVVQDVELAKEMLGCTTKESILDAMQNRFKQLTRPAKERTAPAISAILPTTQIEKKKPSQQEEVKPKKELLDKVQSLRPEKRYKVITSSGRHDILKTFKEVYKIG